MLSLFFFYPTSEQPTVSRSVGWVNPTQEAVAGYIVATFPSRGCSISWASQPASQLANRSRHRVVLGQTLSQAQASAVVPRTFSAVGSREQPVALSLGALLKLLAVVGAE